MSRLGSSDDFFFWVTALSPISIADFLSTYSCIPPQCTLPASCLSGCALDPSAPSGHELFTFLAYVYTRRLDTGYHRFHSPCDSHLSRHVLAATSLVWPVTLAHHLVHLGNVIRRTCLLHSTFLVNAEASSNQLLLFADWVVLGTLIVAWKSRHTRVDLLGLASCRALPRLLGQLTGNPVQRLGLVLDIAALSSTHQLELLHVLLPSTPWTRAVYCVALRCTAQIPAGTVVACSTRLHQTSSIDTIRLVVACTPHDVHASPVRCFASFYHACCSRSTLQVLQCGIH